MGKKVSRRDFAKTSVAAGAAAAFPGGLVSQSSVTKVPNGKKAGAKHTQDGSGERSAPSADGAPWREGHTIPAEYYIDEERYIEDEHYFGDHFWLIADHESRIPNPGDYFVFAFGRGESVIVLRDKASEVKAYYNVCRHRGSPVPPCRRTSAERRAPFSETAQLDSEHARFPLSVSRVDVRYRRASDRGVRDAE